MKVKINAYKFEELPEEIKEKVINEYRDINVDYEWWEFTELELNQKLEKIGIIFTDFYFAVGDRDTYIYLEKAEIYDVKKFLKYCEYDLRKKETKEIIYCGLTIKTDYCLKRNYIVNAEWESEIKHDLTEVLNDILRQTLKKLEEEYFYLISNEVIEETLKANEYLFDKYGRIINSLIIEEEKE